MQISELDPATLRRLSGLRPERGKVLSIYLNLDPHEFATPPARSTAITSLLDEADRKARDDGLDHEERMALRADVERAREFFSSDFTPKQAGSLAIFVCGPAGLFEALRLPQPVASEVVVDDSPWIEPLARFSGSERVCVVLVNRRRARILVGSRERLEEVDAVEDDVHGWHDQGGWSQLRYQRGIEKEVQDHLAHTSRRLFALSRRRPFDQLLVGATAELWPAFERQLHPYVRERAVARFDVDGENATPEQVRAAVVPLLDQAERERRQAALERLHQGLGGANRAEAGLDAVLGALNERRVELLLFEEGEPLPGVTCPRCGWLGVDVERCPLDDTPIERRDNVVEPAVEAAVLQSAQPVPLEPGTLTEHGRIAALLRF
jgi:peptide subunit release factor 1 (eRF1)